MGHTYIYPESYDLSTTLHINGYNAYVPSGDKTIQGIINDFDNLLGADNYNVLLMKPSDRDGVKGIYYSFAFKLNFDPLYVLSGPWPDATGDNPLFIVNDCGVSGIPQSAMGYGFDGARFFTWQSAYIGNVQTYDNVSYVCADGFSDFHAVLIIKDYTGEVYKNNQNVTPITYHWQPVSHLAGNDNQFYLELSQIDASIIGDGDTATYSEDESKFILTNASNFNRLLANVPNNVETVIAYCGKHYMTVTRQYDPPALIRFKLKFYFGPDMLVYETDEMVINDPPINNPRYLSFIIDEQHEVAALDTIQHLESIERYNYNEEGLPDAADMLDLYIWLSDNGEEHPENDPYATGSTDDGGEPGNPRTQDHITDTPAPTISGLNLGIVTLYKPDAYDLQRISQFLWSDDVLDNFKKYFNNFADNILALYVLPFSPDNLPTKAFTVGKLTSEDPVLQDVPYCTTRFYDIDMGSVQINGRWGSYLDYSPYTRIEIYLPYCGLHSLDIDELMSPAKQNGVLPAEQGCTLSLKYRLDILTGVIVAKISVNGELRYQFNGKVGINIPLTGQTYSNLLGAIIGAAGGAAVTVASGGMTAPLAVGAIASAAGTVMAQKPNVESIGNISADASMLATKIPYIRLTSPNKPLLEDQQNFTGFPSYKSGTLSEFSGYTEVLEAHVEGIACTEEERSEILTLLKAGVIL